MTSKKCKSKSNDENKTEADPYGMTNKKNNGNSKSNSKSNGQKATAKKSNGQKKQRLRQKLELAAKGIHSPTFARLGALRMEHPSVYLSGMPGFGGYLRVRSVAVVGWGIVAIQEWLSCSSFDLVVAEVSSWVVGVQPRASMRS
jgi:hypothetical protein